GLWRRPTDDDDWLVHWLARRNDCLLPRPWGWPVDRHLATHLSPRSVHSVWTFLVPRHAGGNCLLGADLGLLDVAVRSRLNTARHSAGMHGSHGLDAGHLAHD